MRRRLRGGDKKERKRKGEHERNEGGKGEIRTRR